MKKMTKKNGAYYASDFPDFRPNLSPRDIFKKGSFGGTYWRPIKSRFFRAKLKNEHLKYPKSWWKGIPDNYMTNSWASYDKNINKYKAKVGTTLSFWESKGWIKKSHPYGWVQWYCDFFSGKRGPDDTRQIKRWLNLAGPKGRFRKGLVTQVLKHGSKSDWNNPDISPAMRQTLQHWAYELTKSDFNKECKERGV